MIEPKISLDWNKFIAMVHYICHAVANDPQKLGKTKLQKILWHSDREAYLRLGSPISGAGYVKMPNGPAAPKLDKALKELEQNGLLIVSDMDRGPHRQKVFFSRKEPILSFTADEVAIIDRWIREILPKTAAQVSDDSHDLTWQIHEIGETIRYESAFLPSLGTGDPDGLEEARQAMLRAHVKDPVW